VLSAPAPSFRLLDLTNGNQLLSKNKLLICILINAFSSGRILALASPRHMTPYSFVSVSTRMINGVTIKNTIRAITTTLRMIHTMLFEFKGASPRFRLLIKYAMTIVTAAYEGSQGTSGHRILAHDSDTCERAIPAIPTQK
jgi:hypothetical protein